MRFSSSILAAAALLSTAVSAQNGYKGFNYGAFFNNQQAKKQADFEYEFNAARQLPGTNGQFTSARLYSMIQWGTQSDVIEAIQAAINTKTTLLLGMWASSGQASFNNEITALKAAIARYGTAFTDLVVGISVGSEDLYRITPTSIANKGGPGAQPNELLNYIKQTRDAIRGTGLASKPVGHVDTWTAYANSSNNAVISALDFLGMDAYPYFQTTMANSIQNANQTFYDALRETVAASQGKPVWVTETGWPVIGQTQNQAVASADNARIYWEDVSCSLMAKNVNFYYYMLQEAQYGNPSPDFGIKGPGDLMNIPTRFQLTCPGSAKPSPSDGTSSGVTPTPSLSVTTSLSATITATPSQGPCSFDPSRVMQTCFDWPKPPAPISSTASSIEPPGLPTATPATTTMPEPSTFGPSPTPTQTSIPLDLSTVSYERPSLIVPVDRSQPDAIIGNQYIARITPSQSSLFNFDVRPEFAGKTCTLVFQLPALSGSSWWRSFDLRSSGSISVSQLDKIATDKTSFNSVGNSQQVGGADRLEIGTGHVISSAPCEAGKTVSYKVDSANGLELEYFQMASPTTGLFMTVSG